MVTPPLTEVVSEEPHLKRTFPFIASQRSRVYPTIDGEVGSSGRRSYTPTVEIRDSSSPTGVCSVFVRLVPPSLHCRRYRLRRETSGYEEILTDKVTILPPLLVRFFSMLTPLP